MMPPASAGQRLLIDARRHEECGHPTAQSLASLEFLACKRCGTTFVDGQVKLSTPQLAAEDPPGEHHLSSYAGEHWEEAAASLVGAAVELADESPFTCSRRPEGGECRPALDTFRCQWCERTIVGPLHTVAESPQSDESRG